MSYTTNVIKLKYLKKTFKEFWNNRADVKTRDTLKSLLTSIHYTLFLRDISLLNIQTECINSGKVCDLQCERKDTPCKLNRFGKPKRQHVRPLF